MKKRVKRNWHPNFLKYMDFIVNHKNYLNMPNKYKANKEINWVSPSDKLRAEWWDRKKEELKCSDRAEVARKIHPKELGGLKPCQICGRKMNINYVYPNKRTLFLLNQIQQKRKCFFRYKEDIFEIIDVLLNEIGQTTYSVLAQTFKIPIHINKNKNDYIQYIIENCSTKLSPGAMSNPPDRLDGFHTYNACCRSKEDTGRHHRNLARYTQDRRAYENWADGNWNLANRLMGEFKKYSKKEICPNCNKTKKISADHIGPISLGFSHRPNFIPICKRCNSKKNNRMTLEDVFRLIKDENCGEQVISWHSQHLWNILKNKITTNTGALKLSKIMRVNLHHILIIFSIISDEGFDEFLLRFLHPEHAFVDYKFSNFDPINGTCDIHAKEIKSKNKQKNKERYIRISFESLEDYKNVKNRNVKKWHSRSIDDQLENTLTLLKTRSFDEAETSLKMTLKKLAEYNARKFPQAHAQKNLWKYSRA